MSREALDLRSLAAEKPVHFMGMGGAGMCALAELVLRHGGRVSGCDAKHGEALRDLEALGATVHIGHDPAHVTNASVLVVTSAVPSDHPELLAARSAGVPVVKRARALGDWVASGTVVAVAGTHGKTTTTAMATEILAGVGLDPTGLVGGRVTGWQSNLRFGSDRLFVVEADEYDRSFLTLLPDVAIITNVEADHLDIYGDLAGVKAAFADFAAGTPADGRIIVCADDHGASSLLAGLGRSGYTYGTSAGSMLRATDVSITADETKSALYEEGRHVGVLSLQVGGRHNLLNALAAAAAARALEAQWPDILGALQAFAGVGRRFERLGEHDGVAVVDDYAHHPTEVRATLDAARTRFPDRRLVAAFQPHLFSRTRDFATEFGSALALADVVWVTSIFPAREAPIEGVTGELVAEATRAAGATQVHYHPDLATLPDALVAGLQDGDMLVTMGAGSIETVGHHVLERMGAGV
ncbi:MAG: UDP-N-acetylmuramate--L-alanine ligase, partial [Gemmatimonadota bacterium]|nr:UDP-N-acetylmuramate--L-alanine ligase [Gemmatimonadota bacterium]